VILPIFYRDFLTALDTGIEGKEKVDPSLPEMQTHHSGRGGSWLPM